jgi:hypothetical protein
MGQNNDPDEKGDLQGQQGGELNLPPEERKRQSGYPNAPGGQDETRADSFPRGDKKQSP